MTTLTNQNQNEANEEDRFYSDLDEKKSHKSCCTCQTMIIAALVVLLLLAGIVFYIYYRINHGSNTVKQNTTTSTIQDVNTKIQNPTIDKNGKIQLILTSDELNTLLSEGLSSDNYLLKDIQVTINLQNLLIYGTLVKPMSSKITVTAAPEVANGKINLKINSVTAGSIGLPAVITKSSSDSISELLNKKLQTFYDKYTTESVTLRENQIIIVGIPKGE